MRSIGIGIVAAVVLLGGCATQLKPLGEVRKEEKHNYVQNYKIGEPRTVTVGEPMVKVQDYWTEVVESPAMIPDRSVTVNVGMIVMQLNAGSKYPVKGSHVIKDVEYTAVATTDRLHHHAILVKSDGSIYTDAVLAFVPEHNGYVQVIYPARLTDPAVRFKKEAATTVKSAKGYENFELLYTGTSGSTLNLTYREFSPEGLARVAFFQNLTYDANAKTIAFKKFRIQVEKATSESITYTVQTDGR